MDGGATLAAVQVEVGVLGGLAVVVDGRPVHTWPSRRAAQLVALLALAPNGRLATEQAMDALWPDLTPEAARANLHKAATLARQAMGSKEAVILKGDLVALAPAADLTVDLATFEAAGDPDLYAGEVLPEYRYDEWTIPARDRAHRRYLDVLRKARRWTELAEADPTDEAAHREIMREQVRAGHLHAAIRQFQRLTTILGRELGVMPHSDTVALYREIVGTATSGWVRPGLVGREVELVRARAALRRAAEGRPAAVFVTGAAGIGKSRLCEELVDQAAGEGWLVLRGAGREQTASVPYWPLVEAVQAALLDRSDVAGALGAAERVLLARLTGLGPDHDLSVHRHAVLHLVSRVIAAHGAPNTMLFLDDLHHADDDTLALAEVLASASMPRGALLLAAYRPDADPRTAAIAGAMVARGIGVEIDLAPLARAESDAMVAGLLDRPGSEAELDLAWELSEGNPFFALEVASALPDATGAYAAVDVRLERLPAEARALLRSVAIVAHEFTADEFAALAGLDGDAALDHLGSALAAGVVARQGSSYRFRHDLVRDRLTQSASDEERAAAHAGAAEHLAALDAPPARLVHHLLAAGREQEALPWMRRAAAEAVQVGAHADALVVIDRGLAIAPHDAGLLALRADAMNGLGDPGAPAAYALAMAVSPEPERAALGVRRAKALVLAGDIPAAIETLATFEQVPPAAEGQHQVVKGLAFWCTGALDDAEAAGREAKRIAEDTGSLRDFVDATMVLAMVAHERGVWPQRLSLDLLDAQIRPDLAAVVMDAHLCIAESYLYGGVPYPEIIRFAEDLRREAVAAASPRAEAFATTLLGEAHLLMGDTEAATPYLRSAVDQYRRVGHLCGEALSLQRLAQALLAEGRPGEAQTALGEALMAARGSPVGTRHLLDRVHGTAIRSAPDPETALAAVDEAARAVRGPFESCPPCSINLMVPAAIACADAGDLARAGAYLAGSEQVAGAFYPTGGWLAALDEARAHVALADGDVAGAGRLLTSAMDAFEHLGQRLDARRCRADLDALVTAGKV